MSSCPVLEDEFWFAPSWELVQEDIYTKKRRRCPLSSATKVQWPFLFKPPDSPDLIFLWSHLPRRIRVCKAVSALARQCLLPSLRTCGAS